MIRSRKEHPMRRLSLAALFWVSLAASSGALAQEHDVVLSVEGWPKMGTRADGKVKAQYVGFRTVAATPTEKSTVRDFSFNLPLGDAAALFMKHALEGRVLKTVLAEAFTAGTVKPPARAPFAVRLYDVRVTYVNMNVEYGIAVVELQASKVEVFTAKQTATGVMQPGQQFGWDIRAGKGM
jgi:heme A synthase